MKIVHLVPGSGGGFYCENCVRDAALVAALRRQGHDVVLVPMYLPLYFGGQDLSGGAPLFFGGINVYLQQQFALFRRTPRWLDRWLDARWLIALTARRASSVRAYGLGAMTLSMLRGEDGHQAKELDRLLVWLAEQEKPDLVHLSNMLLIGLARPIRERLRVPVVCSLEDEDTWIRALDPPYDRECRDELVRRAADVDALIAVSRYYAGVMREWLGLAPKGLHTVHLGVDLTGHGPAPLAFDPPVLGYLARMAECLGLGTLVDAFIRLKQQPRHAALRLRITGGQTSDDRRFLRQTRARLGAQGLAGQVDFLEPIDRASRLAFLEGLTLFSVPARDPEAFGLYLLEAMASGVPVVEPRLGGFPEIVETAGGGVLYEPHTAEGLATALDALLADPARVRELGRQAREGVAAHFSVERMARETAAVYAACRGERR